MKRPPLLIISLPRSGSSMMAGIFVQHGYWYGTCAEPTERRIRSRGGYYENKKVMKLMREIYGYGSNQGDVAYPTPGFALKAENLILDDGYPDDNSPWLIKMGAAWYYPWAEIYPNATVLVMRRPILSITKGKGEVTQERINSHLPIFDKAMANGGFRVDYDQIVDGNYSQLEPIFAKEGIEMDVNKIKEFVKPELRHHKC